MWCFPIMTAASSPDRTKPRIWGAYTNYSCGYRVVTVFPMRGFSPPFERQRASTLGRCVSNASKARTTALERVLRHNGLKSMNILTSPFVMRGSRVRHSLAAPSTHVNLAAYRRNQAHRGALRKQLRRTHRSAEQGAVIAWLQVWMRLADRARRAAIHRYRTLP